jgi:hypothetical protein
MDGVSGRLPRYDPRQDIVYKKWVIPKGVGILTSHSAKSFAENEMELDLYLNDTK